ncbi:MAG: hypothetical protein KBA14_01705 [Saprospiraceae bacterium]|nr:hypothetical protein [Saprospiraceae bacterium]
MAVKETVDPDHKKDIWDKAEIVLHPLGGLITAITIAMVSYYASDYINRNQENEAKTRLYTELMSRREESESALRKDMFTSIIGTILQDDPSTLDEKILQLELLAYNFHESLNLTPLFTYLNRRNNNETTDRVMHKAFKNRIYDMSKEVTTKQLASLEGVATTEKFVYFYDSLAFSPNDTFSCMFLDSIVNGEDVERIQHFVHLTILEKDTFNASVNVRLKIGTQIPGREDKVVSPEFSIDFFEFPMIDNTRLINDKRCAVVLRDFDTVNKFIELDLIFFPGSHSSLKERPYYDDIVAKLLPSKR